MKFVLQKVTLQGLSFSSFIFFVLTSKTFFPSVILTDSFFVLEAKFSFWSGKNGDLIYPKCNNFMIVQLLIKLWIELMLQGYFLWRSFCLRLLLMCQRKLLCNYFSSRFVLWQENTSDMFSVEKITLCFLMSICENEEQKISLHISSYKFFRWKL